MVVVAFPPPHSAGCNPPKSPLPGAFAGAAAGGADFFAGVGVVFEGAVWENDGADVPALHDERAEAAQGALGGDEGVTHFQDRGDMGDGAVDGVAIEFFVGEAMSGDGERGLSVLNGAVDGGAGAVGGNGGGVGGGVDAGVQNGPGHGAVHVARVDIGVAEAGGDEAGDAAFAGGSRAVNGDDWGGVHGH